MCISQYLVPIFSLHLKKKFIFSTRKKISSKSLFFCLFFAEASLFQLQRTKKKPLTGKAWVLLFLTRFIWWKRKNLRIVSGPHKTEPKKYEKEFAFLYLLQAKKQFLQWPTRKAFLGLLSFQTHGQNMRKWWRISF